jgi:hypothetical protein
MGGRTGGAEAGENPGSEDKDVIIKKYKYNNII